MAKPSKRTQKRRRARTNAALDSLRGAAFLYVRRCEQEFGKVGPTDKILSVRQIKNKLRGCMAKA